MFFCSNMKKGPNCKFRNQNGQCVYYQRSDSSLSCGQNVFVDGEKDDLAKLITAQNISLAKNQAKIIKQNEEILKLLRERQAQKER